MELIKITRDLCKYNDILASTLKLFFIKYTPEHTMQQHWELIQVKLEASSEIHKEGQSIDTYHCIFLAKHSNNMKRATSLVDSGQSGIGTYVAPRLKTLSMVIAS